MKKGLSIAFAAVVAFSFATGCKKEIKSIENLKAAITGETTASAKYAAFAARAKQGKKDAIAALFNAASKAESIHAQKHTAVLEKLGQKFAPTVAQFSVKTTKENLAEAIKGETYEVETMYPGFIKTAETEQQPETVMTFSNAMGVEKVHAALYTKALKALEDTKLKALATKYSVCPICGNTFENGGPANCDVCGAAQATFLPAE